MYRGGRLGAMNEWMKGICLCFTPSRIALAEGTRETVRFQLVFFCLEPLSRDCTTFTLHDLTDFYVERVTAHRIKINDHSCFHNRLPNSKTKGGPWCFGGSTQLAYSAYREDRLCVMDSDGIVKYPSNVHFRISPEAIGHPSIFHLFFEYCEKALFTFSPTIWYGISHNSDAAQD